MCSGCCRLSRIACLCCADVKLAVVSNFDTRLRPLLKAMQLDTLFDAIIVSAVRLTGWSWLVARSSAARVSKRCFA